MLSAACVAEWSVRLSFEVPEWCIMFIDSSGVRYWDLSQHCVLVGVLCWALSLTPHAACLIEHMHKIFWAWYRH